MMARKYRSLQGASKAPCIQRLQRKIYLLGPGFLLTGLVLGALTMSLVNMWLGALVLVGSIVGGMLFTASKTKRRASC